MTDPTIFLWIDGYLNADLVRFQPNPRVVADFEAQLQPEYHSHQYEQDLGAYRAPRVLDIRDGHGPVNLDYYSVVVNRMPTVNGRQMTGHDLVEYIRTHLSDFVTRPAAGGTFGPYDTASAERWRSSNPVGSVMRFVTSPDDLSVLCTHADSGPDSARWVFTTVQTPRDHQHAVSGHREFGVCALPNGDHVFYTRGADRATGILDNVVSAFTAAGQIGFTSRPPGILFGGGDRMWRAVQSSVIGFVDLHGGQAHAEEPSSDRYDWDQADQLAGAPTHDLPTPEAFYIGPPDAAGAEHTHADQSTTTAQPTVGHSGGGLTGTDPVTDPHEHSETVSPHDEGDGPTNDATAPSHSGSDSAPSADGDHQQHDADETAATGGHSGGGPSGTDPVSDSQEHADATSSSQDALASTHEIPALFDPAHHVDAAGQGGDGPGDSSQSEGSGLYDPASSDISGDGDPSQQGVDDEGDAGDEDESSTTESGQNEETDVSSDDDVAVASSSEVDTTSQDDAWG